MPIHKAGDLIEHMLEASKGLCPATPHTDIFVRIGANGPMYRIEQMKGQRDQLGFRLILETHFLPEGPQ